MLLGSRGSRVRCLSVWIVATFAAAAVARAALVPLRRAPLDLAGVAETPVDVALTEVAALALLGCAAWLWVVTTVVIAGALRGTPAVRPPRGVPAGVRRVVLAACGVALVGGLAAQPSYADGSRLHVPHPHGSSPLAGLPLPDRALSSPDRTPPSPERARPTPTPAADPGQARARTVRVAPGDSLWSIAAEDLPAGSSDADIATRWQQIYRANRTVVGPDPDLIVTGQVLHLPREDAS